MIVASMIVKIVVWGRQCKCGVDLKKALANCIAFLNKANVHRSDPCLCRCECLDKGWIKHQLCTRAIRSVGRLELPSRLTSKTECKGSLAMGCHWIPMIANSLAQTIGSPYVQMPVLLSKEVDTALRHSSRQCSTSDRVHCQQPFKRIWQCLNVRLKRFVHALSVPEVCD